MAIFTSQIAIVLLLLLSATAFHISMSSNHKVVCCNEKDRGILLIFKQGLFDCFDRLSTWSTEEDCCAWKGVDCDNITSRVTMLDLKQPPYWEVEEQYKPLEGEINFSILELEFLSSVDLSWNRFDAIIIPPVRFNFSRASNLLYLNLSSNYNDLYMDNLQWLSRLSSLKYLNLNIIDLRKETNWLQSVAMLPSLLELHLRHCNLNNISSSLKYVNFTSLVTFDLSDNNFNSKLPYWLLNLSSGISHLDLSGSSIHDEMPPSLLYLRNLSYLDLSYNRLKGPIPDWIGLLEHIQYLDLSCNMFCGSFPSALGNVTSLVSLYIGSNRFSGALSKKPFSKLSNLEFLDLTSSTFSFQFDPEWIPPFQLDTLSLANTNQGPTFPSWIYTHKKKMQILDLSSSSISLAYGNKFWSFVEGIYVLCLSNNSMSGDISKLMLKGSYIELDHNNFTGGLPYISPMAKLLDLSHNSFSGSIPHGWENLQHLQHINLWSNRLCGEVLVCLSNLKQLEVLNIGKNEFSGTIPIKIPKSLEVIILRANQFEGNIPPQLFNLSFLFHLDLAHNKFSGTMPECVYNMTHMIRDNINIYASATIDLFTKGQDYVYRINPARHTIDLSANNLFGEVPIELFWLIQVQTLNLSHNNLSGTIPKTIGGMENLESLDLSNNNISGEIPQSMTLLTFLGYLNLSSNHFIGQIPIGTQLQSFNASNYIGNPELCGAPLIKCITKEENPKNANPSAWNEDGDPLRESLYLGMGVGFAVGFWGVCSSLFLVRKWWHTYFWFLDRVTDQLYFTLMVKFNSFGKTRAPAS